MRYLRRVTRILEHHHILSVQADGATFLVFRKQVLHEIEDGCVTVMTLFGEQGRDPSVSAIRSSMTTRFLVLGSNNDAFGKPSSNCKLGMFIDT